MSSEFVVYETPPYSCATFNPRDNFDTLTRSMRELTWYADHISRALAEPGPNNGGKPAITAKDDTGSQVASLAVECRNLHLPLRPRIDWKETSEGFEMTAVTLGSSRRSSRSQGRGAGGIWRVLH